MRLAKVENDLAQLCRLARLPRHAPVRDSVYNCKHIHIHPYINLHPRKTLVNGDSSGDSDADSQRKTNDTDQQINTTAAPSKQRTAPKKILMPARNVLNTNSLSDKMTARTVSSDESPDPRNSTIHYIPQLANTQRVPLYTPTTDHLGPCVTNAARVMHIMDTREQATAHMQLFDVTTANATRQLGW